MSGNSALVVAQLTDLHLFAQRDRSLFGLSTHDSLQAVLARLCQLEPQPDLLLLTGDISQDETDISYYHLQDYIAPLKTPTYWIPGNHDNLPLMQRLLDRPPISTEKSFTAGGWHFLLLSSWQPQCVHGQLTSESLEWLDNQLQEIGDKPTIITLHHPPCQINSDWMDAINLKNSEDFFKIIDRYPQIKLVLFGHIHQEFTTQRRGVYYLGSPSTCGQFKPQSKEFAIDEQAQPGFRLLALLPDGTFETRIERVKYSQLSR